MYFPCEVKNTRQLLISSMGLVSDSLPDYFPNEFFLRVNVVAEEDTRIRTTTISLTVPSFNLHLRPVCDSYFSAGHRKNTVSFVNFP